MYKCKFSIARRGLLAITTLAGILASASLAAQTPVQIQNALDAAYAKYRNIKEGANADYIPALAKVDPKIYGIALVTNDGKVYTAGDVKSEVSIQSISKVFTMAKVIEDQGPDAIEKRIGVDATGMRFNSIVSVEFAQKALGGPEINPLVNPGAITATSMVQGATRDEVWKKILDFHSAFAGRPLTINKEVFDSEAATNQRNQAIGALMYAYGYIKANPAQATDIYTEQCAISVNARDLATMAATLANAGKNPVSGKQVMKPQNVPRMLAVMATAGLYDDSGQMALSHRPARKERRRRRHHRGLAGQVRDRRRVSAARCGGQQRPCTESDRGRFERSRRQSLRAAGALSSGLRRNT
jgi:glutaminase